MEGGRGRDQNVERGERLAKRTRSGNASRNEERPDTVTGEASVGGGPTVGEGGEVIGRVAENVERVEDAEADDAGSGDGSGPASGGQSESGEGKGRRERVVEGVRRGWEVGVCGMVERAVWGKDGGGTKCEFVTEFIAPGAGGGNRGAGARLLAAAAATVYRGAADDDEWEGKEVHGHVWRRNERAVKFWTGRGFQIEWGRGSAGGVGGRVYDVGGKEGEWGYMRATWEGDVAARLDGHPACRRSDQVEFEFCEYASREQMREDAEVYAAVVSAMESVHQGEGA